MKREGIDMWHSPKAGSASRARRPENPHPEKGVTAPGPSRRIWKRWVPALAMLAACAMAFSPLLAEAKAVKKSTRGKTRVESMRQQDISSALIIDADNGKVVFAEDANARRYPASLTKMMTLYLTFEAIKNGKLKLNQEMYISAHAANMPQTNLALRAGSYLAVETAIRALVVRSANDAAVVLGETLGGSEPQFGAMMTSKARQLGMSNTVFKNASGLPNREQHTTARDLAVLAMALQKHYPQFYHYFKTTQFAYQGKTYTTHNRVLLNYPGCDGLKTGFIGASGFNLVSSVHRNNRHLVGVVLGGPTWAARDRRMMDLMDSALGIGAPLQVAKNKNAGPVLAAAITPAEQKKLSLASNGVPLPQVKPSPTSDETAHRLAQSVEQAQAKNLAEDRAPQKSHAVEVASLQAGTPEDTVGQGDATPLLTGRGNPVGRSNEAVTSSPVPGSPAQGNKAMGETQSALAQWGIQVGAFGGREEAAAAALEARSKLPKELAHAQPLPPQSQSGGAVQRARLGNLNEQEARIACRKLVQMNKACFVFQVN